MFPNFSSRFVNVKHREFCVWEPPINREIFEKSQLRLVNIELTYYLWGLSSVSSQNKDALPYTTFPLMDVYSLDLDELFWNVPCSW